MNDDALLFARATELHQAGDFAAARTLYQDILGRIPDHVETMLRLALMAYQEGHAEEAVHLADRVTALAPDFPAAHVNRGTFLLSLDRCSEALASFDRAIALDPGDAMSHNNRGVALEALGRPLEAVMSFGRALELNPRAIKAYIDRASILLNLRRLEDCIADCSRALALNPDDIRALDLRGVALFQLRRYDKAVADFDRIIAIDPTYGAAHRNRAGALDELKRLPEAIESYNRALQCAPDMPLVAGNRLNDTLQICDWHDFQPRVDAILAEIDAGGLPSVPFILLPLPSSLAQQRRNASRYFAHRTRGLNAQPLVPGPARQKIHVGYFSADFHNHAVSHAIAEMFECHDKSAFEVTAFQLAPWLQDDMHARLRKTFDRYVDASAMSDYDVAAKARDLKIDIAIDLLGYTTDNRPGIFALRAAPVQASYIGYPGTMGTTAIDYILADRTVIPDHHRQHYDEKVCYLPNSYQANDSKRVISGGVFTRRQFGLPEDGFVYCCFNQCYKFTPDVFDSWVNILRRVDGSVLWLNVSNEIARANLQNEARKRGLPPERIVFADTIGFSDHLARQRLADLFLDTFNYCAHGTASHALWAGLPLLTKRGETFAGRVAASLLNAIGLPDLIVDTVAQYEDMAVALATHREQLAAVKSRLGKNRATHPLFDTQRFTKNMEVAYRRMVARARAGEGPADMDVPDLGKN